MWRFLLLAPVYLLASSLPLATPIGRNLEYEYALFASYLALLLIPLSALFVPRRWLPVRRDPASGTDGAGGQYQFPGAVELLWILLLSPLIALLPGGYLFLTGACACSESGFAFWMAVLWYPAWVLAHALYHLVLRSRIWNIRRDFTAAVLALSYVLIIAIAMAELWLSPQKRLANMLLGFLHGPIYDDWIGFDSGVLIARLSHLFAAMLLLFAVWYRGQKSLIAAMVLTAFLWGGTAYMTTHFPSMQSGTKALDALMYQKLEGTGFTLHYRPLKAAENGSALGAAGGANTPDKIPPLSIQRLFRDAQFHVNELNALFAETSPPHVQIYIYPDDDRKKLWFGGGSTDVTDVRTPSIHITAERWPHPTLRHELVHALASGFSYHGIGFHPNMAFTEGLAVALAPSSGTLTLDEGAAALIQSNRLPPMEDLFSPAFWKVSGGRAYTVAGSFIRYVIDKHGILGVKDLYRGKSWHEAIGKDQATLIASWREHVLTGYDAARQALYAEALFRYPGILGDQCPHSKADLLRERNESVFIRMRQPIGWDPRADYLTWVQSLDPQDKETRLKIWRREIRSVAQERNPPEGRLATWRETMARGRTFPPRVLEDAEMLIVEADLARQMGDTAGSAALLDQLAAESQKHLLGDSLERDIKARQRIEAQVAPEQALEWRRYLAGWRKVLPETALQDGPFILNYLKLRNDRDLSTTMPELVQLLNTVTPDAELPPTFATEWYRLLGGRLMRGGEFTAAAAAYTKAGGTATAAQKDVYAEHARRATYYTSVGALQAGPEPGETKASL